MSEKDDTLAIHRSGKAREAFRTISEVADGLELPQHVLRFWESKFSQVRPLKRGGNRRYYRPEDVRLLVAIKALLHGEGYTIRGVQKLFKAQGLKATIAQALHEPLDADAIKRLEGVKPAPSLVEAEQQTAKAAQKQQVVEEKTDQPSAAKRKELSDLLSELRSIRSELT